jgi:hypothetical protein
VGKDGHEEFTFRVGDLRDQLVASVFHEDLYFPDDVLGQIEVPLTVQLDAENLTLRMQRYQLQPKSKKTKLKDCGKHMSQSYLSCSFNLCSFPPLFSYP